MNINTAIAAAKMHWPEVAMFTAPIKDERTYNRMVKLLDAVLDAGGADESNSLASLADLVGERIAAYEDTNKPVEKMSGIELLKHLMKEEGLRQADLPELGNQSVVSLILQGKRKLNLSQVAKLSKRFRVPIEVFVD